MIKMSKFVFVYVFLSGIVDGNCRTALNQQATLVFPEHDDDNIVVIPKCNSSYTFCEEVEIYPRNTFSKFLQDSTYEKYFQTEEEPLANNRFHPSSDYSLCHSTVRTRFPKAAVNTRNEWKFVYNFDKYKQRVVMEECMFEHKPCKPLQGAPKDVKTNCFQKYNDMLLLVADTDGKPVWDLFWFPSACVCSYKPKVNFHRFH